MTTPENQHVLVVEDEPTLLMIMRSELTDLGFSVLAVSNGCAAWEHAQQQHFDLIITDYHVPGMTGADLCRRVRREPGYAETPIILCTSHPRDLYLQRLMDELRLAAIIMKPFELETLRDTVARSLSVDATA